MVIAAGPVLRVHGNNPLRHVAITVPDADGAIAMACYSATTAAIHSQAAIPLVAFDVHARIIPVFYPMGSLMSLFAFMGFGTHPCAAREATLLIGDSATLAQAHGLLVGLQTRFGRVASAGFDAPPATPSTHAVPYVPLPAHPRALRRALARLAPVRLILLGDIPHVETIAAATRAPLFWVNVPRQVTEMSRAQALLSADPASVTHTAGAELTGDPLLGIAQLPEPAGIDDLCERFRAHRKAGRWIGYFAATGVGEEAIAYGTFFTLIRRKMGLLALAPRDGERYEPVYREALKYHLPTNRHNRLSTSFVPIKSRVYYIEDPQTLMAFYRCADFVVAGGSLSETAGHTPDILTPLSLACPVIVGPVRRDPMVRAAIAAGAIIGVDDEPALVEAAHRLLSDETLSRRLSEQGRQWAQAQSGALERVLLRIQ